MLLIHVTKFIKRYFDDTSRPSRTQVQEWVKKGAIPGLLIDQDLYIDQDRFERMLSSPYGSRAVEIPESFRSGGNPILEGVRIP